MYDKSKMTRIIDNKIENILPAPGIFAGYVMLGLGILILFSYPLGGLVLLMAGIFISFSTSGVQIDPRERQIKDYTKCFGIAFGKWENIEIYKDISVLSTRQTYTAYSRANVSMTDAEKFYDVYLLDTTHRKKMKVKRCKGQEEALKEAQLLAEMLELNFTKYNPVISSRTRARR